MGWYLGEEVPCSEYEKARYVKVHNPCVGWCLGKELPCSKYEKPRYVKVHNPLLWLVLRKGANM